MDNSTQARGRFASQFRLGVSGRAPDASDTASPPLVGVSFVVKLVLAAAMLWLLLRSIDVGKVGAMLASSDLELVLASCVCLAVGVALNALRWAKVMDGLERPIGNRTAVVGSFEAMFFNQILPTGVGGDAIRTIRAYDAGASTGFAVMGVLIDRALGVWFVAICLCIAPLIATPAMIEAPAFRVLALTAALVVLGGVATTIVGALIKTTWLPSWAVPLCALVQSFSQVTRTREAMTQILSALFLSNIATIASFALCARALGIHTTWWDATVILQGMTMASILPVSIGGWGVREGAAIVLFSSIGVGASAAAAVSILFGLVLTAIGLVGAMVWLASRYRRFGGLSAPDPSRQTVK